MLRALVVATLCLVVPRGDGVQSMGTLHIRMVLAGDGQAATPVARYTLLISDNPASAPPRVIVTGPDGTADVRLRSGNYTVESDQPLAFEGHAYTWTQLVDVAAGRDTSLELTAGNAEVGPLVTAPDAAVRAEAGAASLLTAWQHSVIGVWTPTAHASALLVDAQGLLVTAQQAVGTAGAVEVQLTPEVKVAGTVLRSDADRGVAVVAVDPGPVASIEPVSLPCATLDRSVGEGQEVVTMGVPMFGAVRASSAIVDRLDARAVFADRVTGSGSPGGPAFGADGEVVGITTPGDESDARGSRQARIVRIATVCAVLADVASAPSHARRPDARSLPVEPVPPYPEDVLAAASTSRSERPRPYQLSSSDFDVAFITPVLTYAAAHQLDRTGGRTRSDTLDDADGMRVLTDFGAWSDYVAAAPAVLLIRATPKLVEGFWTTVGRAAARTQGVSLPPFKHFKTGFARMRAFCGDTEVVPIHPFVIEQRVSETDAIHEGLYAYDPGAFGPACGTVKLVLYSERDPEKGDARVVDPTLLQQIRQDFEPSRAR